MQWLVSEDGNRWRDEFLEYDYIGAPWNVPAGSRNNIGNGGFSLRRKFLEVSSKLRYNPDDCEWLHPSQKLALPIAPIFGTCVIVTINILVMKILISQIPKQLTNFQ